MRQSVINYVKENGIKLAANSEETLQKIYLPLLVNH